MGFLADMIAKGRKQMGIGGDRRMQQIDQMVNGAPAPKMTGPMQNGANKKPLSAKVKTKQPKSEFPPHVMKYIRSGLMTPEEARKAMKDGRL